MKYSIAAPLAALLLLSLSLESSAQEHDLVRRESQPGARFELRPIVGWGSSPGTLSHAFVGGGAYVHVPHLEFGVDVVSFAPFDTNEGTSPYPLNETAWSSTLSLAYSPFRFHVRNDGQERLFLPYVLGGLGAISTRPVSVVDPMDRSFAYKPELTLNAAVGTHVLLSPTIGLDVEVRDTIFSEQLESQTIANGVAGGPDSPTNPSTWYSPASRLTNFVALQFGVSFFAGGR